MQAYITHEDNSICLWCARTGQCLAIWSYRDAANVDGAAYFYNS